MQATCAAKQQRRIFGGVEHAVPRIFTVRRVRLVCTLLETCGSFFCKGKAGRRLDRFLAYFQRYLLAKPPLPLDIDFDVQVCIVLAETCK